MGELLQIDASAIDRLARKALAAAHEGTGGVLSAIGEQQEDAARKRLLLTKRAPNGTPWRPWSKSYAKSRRGRPGSLLHQSGDLARAMQSVVHADESDVEVGSNMVYAAVHLFGYQPRRIPARPYLDTDGTISDPHDREELLDIAGIFLTGLLE